MEKNMLEAVPVKTFLRQVTQRTYLCAELFFISQCRASCVSGTLQTCCWICVTALGNCTTVTFTSQTRKVRLGEVKGLSWDYPVNGEFKPRTGLTLQTLSISLFPEAGSSLSPQCPHWCCLLKGFSKAGNSQSCEYWHFYNVLGPIYALALLKPMEECGWWLGLSYLDVPRYQQISQLLRAGSGQGTLCHSDHVQ